MQANVVPRLKNNVGFVTMTFGMLLFYSLLTLLYFGSFRNLSEFVNGARLLIDKDHYFIHDLKVNQEVIVSFNISNLNGNPVSLLGISSSCGCTGSDDFPILIPSFTTKHVEIRVKANKIQNGRLSNIKLFTTDPRRPFFIIFIDTSSTGVST